MPSLTCQNAKGWPVNHDQNHLVRISLLNDLSGAIAWSLDSPFLSFHFNCNECIVSQQFTHQEDFIFIHCAKKTFNRICPQLMSICLSIYCFMDVQTICMGILHAKIQAPLVCYITLEGVWPSGGYLPSGVLFDFICSMLDSWHK